MRCLASAATGRAVRRQVVPAAVLLAMVLSGCGGQASRPAPAAEQGRDGFAVLVFTRTTGYRHASIDDGTAAIRRLGAGHGFTVHATEDPTQIRDAILGRYRAVVFLSTTGNPLDQAQQAALERWVEAGGGWVGVHAAADAHDHWPWYGELVGARFRRHPRVQPATVQVTDRNHPSTRSLPAVWTRTDEWYDVAPNPRGRVRVLAVVDESTYQGAGMGADHPVSWCHQQGRGRAWYTALGHTKASWSEQPFLAHVLGGIRWVAR
jgi:type 1 glutamine amidotransferase